jgi:thiamine biosynthesis protein ThiS
MIITVNGKQKEFNFLAPSLLDIVTALDLASNAVIIDLNGTLYKSDSFATVFLKEGDILDIVHFMGGGQIIRFYDILSESI